MTTSTCNDGAQLASWCPTTVDEALPYVLALLPPGPAWDGARVEGSVMHQFWRSVARLLAFTYGRLCDFQKEFYCNTASESLDQWRTDHGLPDECDPYGSNLCAKVTAEGGQDCATFVAMAREAGWAISCETLQPVQTMSGGFIAGCARTPPPSVPKDAFPGVFVSSAGCWSCGSVPVGYSRVNTNVCPSGSNVIVFDVPAQNVPELAVDPIPSSAFWSYGHNYLWKVTVDIAASRRLQGVAYSATPISNAGNFMAGCTPLCADLETVAFLKCYFDRIKPAHTVLVIDVIQPV